MHMNHLSRENVLTNIAAFERAQEGRIYLCDCQGEAEREWVTEVGRCGMEQGEL